MTTQSVSIGGHTIRVTHLDRVMYPADGTTKAEVLQYLVAVAAPLGEQLHDRLLTRKRWPHGVAEQSFFEKNLPAGTPDWIPSAMAGRDPIRYPVLRDPVPTAALAWFAQLGVLEFHVPQWRVTESGGPLPPDRIVIDLDPGPPAGLAECATVALAVRDAAAGVGLTSSAVLSGSKGMQVYLPLPEAGPLARGATSEQTSQFARSLAVTLEEALGDLVVSRMTKSLRPGKVLLDWSQNSAAKTTIAPYSPRGTERFRVAAPVSWAEIEAGDLRQVTGPEVLQRLSD
ncbi:MAG: non-homologous end-joining DNA ligase [Candidatus Nanopelagicales bacterium]